MRAACYARFSSDMQRATSIEDQTTTARRYAAANGWEFLERHTYTDAAVSGASLERPGIQALLTAAACQPPPFDVLLVDDSSRVARDLADAVRFLQQLKFFGVRVVYISQQIDSDNDQAETLAAVHGIVDSLYLREMAKKIKRGLAGQIDRGFATGSSTFGYRTVPVPDPSGKTDANGYPALLGKRVEIEPNEARTIVRMFEWYAEGLGIGRIVERLNRDVYSGPRSARWKDGAVKRALANEKYRGLLIWGKKTFERRPGTRQHVHRAVPREQWRTLERPELRIVPDDLWYRVQARRDDVRGTLPTNTERTLMRGRNAALYSPYLFSGFLKCATCGAAIAITSGGHGSPRYGCLNAWRNGVAACTNRLTIRARVADARLLESLRGGFLEPATVAYITEALSVALNHRVDDRDRLLTETQAAREQTAERLDRLIRAIENGAPTAALNGPIAERQAELARLDARLLELSELPAATAQRVAIMPSLVRAQLADFAGLLSDSSERTKVEFRRLGLRVEMTPISDEQPRPFYRATLAATLPELSGMADLHGATSGPLALGLLRSTFAGSTEQTEQGATTGRLHPTAAGTSARLLRFSVDLPANHPGPSRRVA